MNERREERYRSQSGSVLARTLLYTWRAMKHTKIKG